MILLNHIICTYVITIWSPKKHKYKLSYDYKKFIKWFILFMYGFTNVVIDQTKSHMRFN